MNLAKYPASTVQILGAEKALFRALKTRSNTPKYGLIFHSTFIGRAGTKNKGRISRFLANKCSIASRIDCFNDFPTDVFGTKLREQVEERLKYFEDGNVPRKNTDVMKEALEEAVIQNKIERKKRKKERKRKREEAAAAEADEDGEAANGPTSNGDVTMEDGVAENDNGETPSKKKKKKKKGKVSTDSLHVKVEN